MAELQKRNKWANPSRSLRVNDLVFIKDELTPPSQWMMGRIMEVYPDQSGHVRTCKVMTKRSELYQGRDGAGQTGNIKTVQSNLVRPVTSLCLLPVNDETSIPFDSGFSP